MKTESNFVRTDRNAILEATSSISSGLWQPVTTNKLSSGSVLLTDPEGTGAEVETNRNNQKLRRLPPGKRKKDRTV
jgi:hypothetical protein